MIASQSWPETQGFHPWVRWSRRIEVPQQQRRWPELTPYVWVDGLNPKGSYHNHQLCQLLYNLNVTACLWRRRENHWCANHSAGYYYVMLVRWQMKPDRLLRLEYINEHACMSGAETLDSWSKCWTRIRRKWWITEVNWSYESIFMWIIMYVILRVCS